MTKIKIGIIGCGIAARKLHWPALQKLTDKYEISMVCNHTEEKARSFSQLAGDVPYVTDYKLLLENPEIEAVLIALSIQLNYRVTLDALKAEKHVLLEKPIAANLEEARKMLLFKKLYKPVKMVAENFRYHPTFLKIRNLIDADKIGNVFSVSWTVAFQLTTQNPYAQTKWRIKHEYPGGFITDGGVHNIAALRMLCGEFTDYHACANQINPDLGSHDMLDLLFKTETGVSGNLKICYSAMGYDHNVLTLFGDNGTIKASGYNLDIYNPYGKTEQISVEEDGGYYAQLLDFYQAITENTVVRSTFEEGFRDLEIILNSIQYGKQADF